MRHYVKPQSTSNAEVDKFLGRKLNLSDFLFDKQLAFVEDPAPFKVAVCSRRAGKTIACAAHLIRTALDNPDTTGLYITLSGTSGKRIIWKEFKNILKKFDIKAKVNDLELSVTFSNNATIYVAGAKDNSEIEKFRGLAMKLVYIDECQSFREYIKDLIDDIIGPALMDYAGSLCLIGTPGPIPNGYFYDCLTKTDNDWAKHVWTFWDNPHIALKSKMTHQQVLDREMRRRGITDINDPSIQREWFGKWVLDADSLVLHYDEKRNGYQELPALPPTEKWHYLMGIDVGFNDADAIAVLAWSEKHPETYLVDELVTPKQGLTELVDQVQAFRKKYDISKIVMDMGGLGKKLGEEMSRRYLIPVEAAEKSRKMEYIAILNDALRAGRLKAKAKSHFVQDTYKIEYDRDKSRPDRMVISDRFHSDIADAVLYAFRESYAFTFEPEAKKPHPGSKEWAEAQGSSMFEAELEGLLALNQYRDEYGTD